MGKSVMVTGADKGIGLATCLELAAGGWDVIGTARSEDKLGRLDEEAGSRGLRVQGLVLEVDDPASCAQAVEQVEALTGGGPYALVNNAGSALSGAVEDVSDEQVRAQLETNVVAPVRLARLVLPAMRAAGGGRIVNMSSVAGRLSSPLLGWYSASKHALEAVTDALRIEVEPDGVRVVLIEPGMFGSDIWGAARADELPSPTLPRYAAAYARAQALAARSDRLPDPVWVARTVRVALANPVPLARYVVGADAVTGILTESLVPTTITDYVKALGAGLRTLPFRP